MIGVNQCEHGALVRSCAACELQREIADRDVEIARLRATVEKLREAQAAYRALVESRNDADRLLPATDRFVDALRAIGLRSDEPEGTTP